MLEPAGRNVGCGFFTGLMEALGGFHVDAIGVESSGIDTGDIDCDQFEVEVGFGVVRVFSEFGEFFCTHVRIGVTWFIDGFAVFECFKASGEFFGVCGDEAFCFIADERNELDVAGDAGDEEGQVVFAGGVLVGAHCFCLSFGIPVCGVGLVQVFSPADVSIFAWCAKGCNPFRHPRIGVVLVPGVEGFSYLESSTIVTLYSAVFG